MHDPLTTGDEVKLITCMIVGLLLFLAIILFSILGLRNVLVKYELNGEAFIAIGALIVVIGVIVAAAGTQADKIQFKKELDAKYPESAHLR